MKQARLSRASSTDDTNIIGMTSINITSKKEGKILFVNVERVVATANVTKTAGKACDALGELFGADNGGGHRDCDQDRNTDENNMNPDEWLYSSTHLLKLDDETISDQENVIIKYPIMILLILLILIIKLVFNEKHCNIKVFGFNVNNKYYFETAQFCLDQVLDNLLWRAQLTSQENVSGEHTDDNVMDFASDNRSVTVKDKNESGSGGCIQAKRFFKRIGKATIDVIAEYNGILEQDEKEITFS